MDASQFKKAVIDELTRREYNRKTIVIYSRWVDEICRFFPDIPPENITLDDLREYVTHVIERKRFAPGTINQIFHALTFAFNDTLGKGYDLSSIERPRRERTLTQYFSQSEIQKVLQTLTNTKHRTFFALLYSCGMDIGEAVRLKVSDLDLKRGKVRIRSVRKRTVRESVLAKYLIDELNQYLREYQPTSWLFPGRRPDKPLGIRTAQFAFERAITNAGIDKDASLKSLKYSYVKHLEQQGVPVVEVLKHLGLNNPHSLVFYSSLGRADNVEIHNPLDRIINPDDDTQFDLVPLQRMLRKVQDEDERDYLGEAIQSLAARSLRAGIIFAWSAAIHNIRKRCIAHSTNTINLILKKHNPKAPEVNSLDDFARISDSLLLLLAVDLGVYDKNQKDILEGCLDLRNKCGHPGKYRPRILKAASFIEDLITVVFQ